ncbi:MAG: homoserine kinase [Desulfitobacteriaceae bacterium]|nr:homoserine kinase [Desulfitobacteriaceae bacterium]MDD4751764.1 homoserine kinase [Desulfitobacteriaceae bacterium]
MVKVRVPATSANLGPGYDTMGMAFNLYNYVTMEESGTGLNISVQGEGKGEIPLNEDNIVFQAACRVFQEVNYHPKGLKILLENNIPVTRGLGSSASTIVGGMMAANIISGEKLDKEHLLLLAINMEGHPDNVAPALLGGVVVAAGFNELLNYVKIEVPDGLNAVAAIPDFPLATKTAREAVPKEVSLSDAVFNIGHASLLVAALMKSDFNLLGKVMEDKLHQKYRSLLIPGMEEVFSAAKRAGALAVTLSGAGPTLVAFTTGKEKEIAQVMKDGFAPFNVSCRTIYLFPERDGAVVMP